MANYFSNKLPNVNGARAQHRGGNINNNLPRILSRDIREMGNDRKRMNLLGIRDLASANDLLKLEKISNSRIKWRHIVNEITKIEKLKHDEKEEIRIAKKPY